MKKKNKIVIKVNGIKVEDKLHLDAQVRYPARVFENKKAYNRARNKANDRKILFQDC